MWKTSQKVNTLPWSRIWALHVPPLFARVNPCTAAPAVRVPPQLYRTVSLTFSNLRTADIISAVEFDSTGNYLATGDKGGRVVLFERNDMVRPFRPLLCPLYQRPLICHLIIRGICILFDLSEKELRIQVLHRVSVARTRVRLP